MELDLLAGQMLVQISFSHEVWLWAENGDRLAVAEPIDLISPQGARQHLGGDSWVPHASTILGLLWRTVERTEYVQDDRLVVSLADGSSIEVPANPQWEAWRFVRADKWELICAPGGGLLTWSPDYPGGRAVPFRP